MKLIATTAALFLLATTGLAVAQSDQNNAASGTGTAEGGGLSGADGCPAPGEAMPDDPALAEKCKAEMGTTTDMDATGSTGTAPIVEGEGGNESAPADVDSTNNASGTNN